jgi:hypothetical protein
MGPGELPAEDRFESPKVFTEIALVEVPLGYVPRPPVGSSVADITRDPNVVITSVAHVLATQGAPTTIAVAPPGQSTRITVAPTIDRGGTVNMELEVVVDASPNPPAVKTTTMKTTLVMRDQQLVIAGGRQSEGKSLIVLVMPYVVRGKGDLAQLYECKRARAVSPRA